MSSIWGPQHSTASSQRKRQPRTRKEESRYRPAAHILPDRAANDRGRRSDRSASGTMEEVSRGLAIQYGWGAKKGTSCEASVPARKGKGLLERRVLSKIQKSGQVLGERYKREYKRRTQISVFLSRWGKRVFSKRHDSKAKKGKAGLRNSTRQVE